MSSEINVRFTVKCKANKMNTNCYVDWNKKQNEENHIKEKF